MPSGKIYRLVFPDGSYYIGSTAWDLSERLRLHKVKSQRFPERKVYKKALEVGWNSVKIEQFGDEDYEDVEVLRLTESMLIEEALKDEKCLNTNRVSITTLEAEQHAKIASSRYDESHREERRLARKARYWQNPELEREKRRQYYKKNKL